MYKVVIFINMLMCLACKDNNITSESEKAKAFAIDSSGRLDNNKKVGLWRYSDSEGNLIAAKYFEEDSMLTEVDLDDALFISKPFPELGITFSYPSKWEIIDEKNTIFNIRKSCSKEFCTNLVLTVIQDSSQLGQEYYADQYITYIKSRFTNLEILYTGKESFGPFNAYIIDYKLEENSVELGSTIAILKIAENKYLVFNYSGFNGVEGLYFYDRLILEEMLNTINGL